jgi:hypothetical protein
MDESKQRSEAYVDQLFGPGAGARHSRFLERIENDELRALIHHYHEVQADTSQLALEEHYLIGTCVLCATRSFGTAQMFAKTLRHLGVPRAKILEAVARLSMWIGGIPAAEATLQIRRALDEYERDGVGSLAAWFPGASGGKGNGNGSDEGSHG